MFRQFLAGEVSLTEHLLQLLLPTEPLTSETQLFVQPAYKPPKKEKKRKKRKNRKKKKKYRKKKKKEMHSLVQICLLRT